MASLYAGNIGGAKPPTRLNDSGFEDGKLSKADTKKALQTASVTLNTIKPSNETNYKARLIAVNDIRATLLNNQVDKSDVRDNPIPGYEAYQDLLLDLVPEAYTGSGQPAGGIFTLIENAIKDIRDAQTTGNNSSLQPLRADFAKQGVTKETLIGFLNATSMYEGSEAGTQVLLDYIHEHIAPKSITRQGVGKW